LFEQIETVEFRRTEDAPRSRVVVDHLDGAELVAAGGRVRLLAVPEGGHADLEAGERRFRVTLLPDDAGTRLHLKGLNCFVSRAGGRPSSAVDVARDETIDVLSNARKPAGTVRCHFGAAHEGVRLFPVADAALALPREL